MGYILIVGAKSDIAKALAKKYAENGYDIYLAARKSYKLKEFATDINIRTQREVKCLEIDILDFNSHQEFYNSLKEKPLGIILAVGYLGDQGRAQVSFDETNKIISTNFTGIVNLLNIVAIDFEKLKRGFIIGISSVAGDRGRRQNYIYGSAKAGLTVYLSGLRSRLNASQVNVVTVKPGFVATKMTEGMAFPKILTAYPDQVANDIFNAQESGKNIVYTKWMWRWIMLIIKMIPEQIFKKMNI